MKEIKESGLLSKVAVFKGTEVRKTIHNNAWWFFVNDVVLVLTCTTDRKDYIRKMRDCDDVLGKADKLSPPFQFTPLAVCRALLVPIPKAFFASSYSNGMVW
jgi:hypothetical protein